MGPAQDISGGKSVSSSLRMGGRPRVGAWRGCSLNTGDSSSTMEVGAEQREDTKSSGGIFWLESGGVCRQGEAAGVEEAAGGRRSLHREQLESSWA